MIRLAFVDDSIRRVSEYIHVRGRMLRQRLLLVTRRQAAGVADGVRHGKLSRQALKLRGGAQARGAHVALPEVVPVRARALASAAGGRQGSARRAAGHNQAMPAQLLRSTIRELRREIIAGPGAAVKH